MTRVPDFSLLDRIVLTVLSIIYAIYSFLFFRFFHSPHQSLNVWSIDFFIFAVIEVMFLGILIWRIRYHSATQAKQMIDLIWAAALKTMLGVFIGLPLVEGLKWFVGETNTLYRSLSASLALELVKATADLLIFGTIIIVWLVLSGLVKKIHGWFN